jgi:hypothetical protein
MEGLDLTSALLISHTSDGAASKRVLDETTDFAQLDKRMRLEGAGTTSKVLFVRNVPPDMTDAELFAIGGYGGQVARVLLMSQKKNAFIEFRTVDDARNMMAWVALNPVHVR